jgi:DNA-binding response OmpR family regulator
MPKLLIIDDESNVLYSLQTGLESDELNVVTAKTGKRGITLVPKENPDVVIVDVRLPDMSGLEVFDKIKEIAPKVPVIIITAFAATDTAIEAMKRGAFEYLLKPVDLHHLREVVGRALELRRMQSVPAVFDQPEATASDCDTGTDPIIGRSPVMQEVYKSVGRTAPQDVTVLILGENRFWRSTAQRSRMHCWSRNCSGTSGERSRARIVSESGSSSRRTAARSSSMRSGICLRQHRQRCCESYKTSSSSEWVGKKH